MKITTDDKLINVLKWILLPLIATNMIAATWVLITELMAVNGEYLSAMIAGALLALDVFSLFVWVVYACKDGKI